MTREDLLTRALEQILHSVKQARVPGNDVKRELSLIENTVKAALFFATLDDGEVPTLPTN